MATRILESSDETGAAFSLMLTVGPLPEGGETSGEYRLLGWKWPDRRDRGDEP
jgi:hypothetical protein